MSQGKQVQERIFSALTKGGGGGGERNAYCCIFFPFTKYFIFLKTCHGMYAVMHSAVSAMLYFLKV